MHRTCTADRRITVTDGGVDADGRPLLARIGGVAVTAAVSEVPPCRMGSRESLAFGPSANDSEASLLTVRIGQVVAQLWSVA